MEEFDLSFFVFLTATATFVQLLATWLPRVIFFPFQGTHGNLSPIAGSPHLCRCKRPRRNCGSCRLDRCAKVATWGLTNWKADICRCHRKVFWSFFYQRNSLVLQTAYPDICIIHMSDIGAYLELSWFLQGDNKVKMGFQGTLTIPVDLSWWNDWCRRSQKMYTCICYKHNAHVRLLLPEASWIVPTVVSLLLVLISMHLVFQIWGWVRVWDELSVVGGLGWQEATLKDNW